MKLQAKNKNSLYDDLIARCRYNRRPGGYYEDVFRNTGNHRSI